MKLIIDIPKATYDYWKEHKDEYILAEAIANGIPYNPKGDCISREYVESIVRAEFVDLQDGTEEWRTCVNDTCENILIKVHNAPTVEARPQGEWIEKVERRGCFVGDKTVYSYTCPFCGAKEFKKYPFCHCGADMKGGAEND